MEYRQQFNTDPEKQYAPSASVTFTAKPIFVGTVFAGSNDHQQRLLKLQLGYLRATTEYFDHVTIISDGTTNQTFSSATTLLQNPPLSGSPANQHVAGQNRLTDYAKEHIDRYSAFLLLDSDAFPLRRRWPTVLQRQMGPKTMAAPIRYEYLEITPHTSIIFCPIHIIPTLSFVLAHKITLGPSTCSCIVPYQAPVTIYPLLRSNKLNVHPLLCGIYNELFYHHGFGSREYLREGTRPRRSGPFKFWGTYLKNLPENPAHLMDELLNNPREFLNNLGWSRYRKPLT